MRELVSRQLAEQDRAGLIEPRDRRRVLGGNIIRADPRVAGGADADEDSRITSRILIVRRSELTL